MYKAVREFAGDAIGKRLIIFHLARQDFRNRYLGSLLGFAWSFVQPLAMVLILWAVFTLAFNAENIEGAPFAFYLLAGIACWYFFSESISMTTGVFHEYAFMVQKVKFKIAILPLVKILSCLMVHAIFLAVVMVLLLAGGCRLSVHWLQVFYYMFAMVVFLAGLGSITSSLNVFVRDVAQVVNICLQFGFWLTPVVWHIGRIPEEYQWILKLNPIFYLVDGYRGSFLYQTPFWHDYWWTLYFWSVCLVIFISGILIFNRLKPHFADVL